MPLSTGTHAPYWLAEFLCFSSAAGLRKGSRRDSWKSTTDGDSRQERV